MHYLVRLVRLCVMNVVTPPAAPTPAAELAAVLLRVVYGLMRAMAPLLSGHRMAPHCFEVWHAFTRAARRVVRALERQAAGEVARVRPSRAGQVRKPPSKARLRLPMERAWVLKLGWGVRGWLSQLEYALNRPEFAALVAANPQAQRVLRPMLWRLGITVACVPPLPKRPRAARAKPVIADKPKRLTRREREAILWYPNSEGVPMKLLPRRLPRD